MKIKFTSSPSSPPPNFLQKMVAIILTLALLVVAVMFSAILLSIILFFAVIGGAYLWWKTRAIRKHLKTFSQQAESMRGDSFKTATSQGEVFEGEVVHVDKSFSAKRVN